MNDFSLIRPEEAQGSRAVTLLSLSDRLAADGDKQAIFDLTLTRQLFLLADFVLVGLGDEADNTSLCLYARLNNSPYFSPISKESLSRLAIYAASSLRSPAVLTGTRLKRFMETFMHEPAIIPSINRSVFYVSDQLFFDNTAPSGDELTSVPPASPCFFRLFDSDAADKDIVTYPSSVFDQTFSEQVKFSYNSLLACLEDYPSFPDESLSATDQSSDPLPRHFSFIEDWAAGNPGLYWDLMTIPATVFLRDKPSVGFFLSGSGANGKSSYLGLLHSLFGTKNTTRNKLSDMSKWHLNTLLQYTLFNAPDDEGDYISPEAAEFFKSIASHGTIMLPIMRSQKPMRLNADFMSAHPMNAFPDWGDSSSASALTRRTCLIPFTADFRQLLATFPASYNFAQATFTPDVLARFTGEVLALASYYSNHPIKWSTTTQAAKVQVEAENDSVRLYKTSFERFFSGFQSLSLLYDDYKIWCRDQGYSRAVEKQAFQIHWYAYLSNKKKVAVTGADGKPIMDKVNRPVRRDALIDPYVNDFSRIPMMADTVLPHQLSQYGSISQMHNPNDLDKAIGRTSFSAVILMERTTDGD